MNRAAAVPRYHMTFIWLVCLVAAMGGFLFGYDWVVIGGAKPFYEPYFRITESTFHQGLAQSSALVGCLVGAVASGLLTDRFGRRRLLVVSAVLFTVSAVWTALAWDLTSFNLARWIGGVGIGLASNLSPMYIAELSPARMRGRFVSINQLTIVLGILAAQITNWLIAQDVAKGATPEATIELIRQSWNGTMGWRWMFGAETVPAAAFLVLMFFVPESPRWQVKYGRDEAARRTLARVGGDGYAAAELADIHQTLAAEEIGHVRPSDLLQRGLMRVLVLGVVLAVFQQWCGINVIFNYGADIFKAAGYTVNATMFNIVITGIVNLLFTLVAIVTVDRFGRRVLMVLGAAGLAGIYAVLGTCYFFHVTGPTMLVLVLAAIACYAMSLAPVTWVVIAEIFPNRIRGAAMSVAVSALWVGCTVLTFTFPSLQRALGLHGAFWLYGGICLAGFAYVCFALPETKGKSLEAIERELVGSPSRA